jgi:hypothetical protein
MPDPCDPDNTTQSAKKSCKKIELWSFAKLQATYIVVPGTQSQRKPGETTTMIGMNFKCVGGLL